MGLETTHNAWSGPHHAFEAMRAAFAVAAGLPPLKLMEGYSDPEDRFGFGNLGELRAEVAGRAADAWIGISDCGLEGKSVTDVADAIRKEATRDDVGKQFPLAGLPIPWSAIRADPIRILLQLCPIDPDSLVPGRLSPGRCRHLHTRMLELLPKVQHDPFYPDMEQSTREFMAGLDRAAFRGEDLVFGHEGPAADLTPGAPLLDISGAVIRGTVCTDRGIVGLAVNGKKVEAGSTCHVEPGDQITVLLEPWEEGPAVELDLDKKG